MNKGRYVFWLLMVLLLPLKTFSQVEDTCFIPNLLGTGLFLNQLIIQDTAGTGWQGAHGTEAWQNHTRVYVLEKNGIYPCNSSFTLPGGNKLSIRGESGNYAIPSRGNLAIDWLPIIRFEPSGTTSNPQGQFVQCTGANDTVMLKNIAMCGYDEDLVGGLDRIQGALLVIAASGGGSIYVDSCIMKSINGQIIQTAGRANTIQVTNSIFADLGFLGTSNFGAGKGIDLRNSEVDAVIMENNTIVNYQDRIIRHYLSLKPIHSIKFNHNTVINGMSYDAMLSFGDIDSLGEGPFEIKNNLFVDNFAMGADTDYIRQGELNDSPDLDPINGKSQMSWVVAKPNPTAHITPWNISNNYYCISDSGVAIRNTVTPLHTPYPIVEPEPILTSDMKRQLIANGGDAVKAFTKIAIQPINVPKLMTKLIRWYWSPEGDGVGGNTVDNVGAGAGKKKTGSSGTPATHFIKAAPGVWVYDYDRKRTDWYLDSLDCSFSSSVNLSFAASDGKVVGASRWSWTGYLPGIVVFSGLPKTLDFGTVAKNANKADTIIVSSDGSSPLVIDSVKSSAAEFAVTPENATIAVGSTQIFVVTYHPTTPGAKTASIVFYHNAPSMMDTISVSGDVALEANFSATPTSLAFGIVNIGTAKEDSLTVTNHGTVDLTVTSIVSSDPAFTVNPTTATVSVEGTQKFYVTFMPTTVGVVSAKIAFNHNALTQDTILVGGEGQPGTGVAGLQSGIPKVYQLHNNYPNPFNPSTTILYDLPQQSIVTIIIYSILGQQVATLVDGVVPAGYHQVTWGGEQDGGTAMAGGVYFFRMSAQPLDKGTGLVQTKKMLLLK
ncbi:MAG: choice-of-anchor D domain-containing protein [Ignavibacteriales bacterium]|nr:choice-of-anchor D domain-containing protein [Ignavibacteriales bacterium]